MRYLAVDLGDKRTGLAVGDDGTRLADPIEVLEIPLGDALRDAIAQRARDYDADAVVIGLPLHMDGAESPRSKLAREFGAALAEATGLPVHEQDERLTSYAADQRMAQSGRTHGQKKKLRDALAAAEILRDYFESRENR